MRSDAFQSILRKHTPILVLLLLHLALRIPTLSVPAYYDDEHFYLTIGRSVVHGMALFTDVSDIHLGRPGLMYLFAGLAGNQTSLRLLALISNSFSLVFLVNIISHIGSKKTLTYFLGSAFILLTSTPLMQGTIPHDELFYIPFTLLAVYAVLVAAVSHKKKVGFLLFCAGAASAFAVLVKVHALLLFFSLFSSVIIIYQKSHTPFTRSLRYMLLSLSLGFLIPFTIYWTYLLTNAVPMRELYLLLMHGFDFANNVNETYISAAKSTNIKLFAFLVFTMYTYFLRNSLPFNGIIILLYSGGGMAAALLMNSIGLHYTLQFAPALILILALILSKSSILLRNSAIGLVCFWILMHAVYPIRYSLGSIRWYYTNYVMYVTKLISKADYYRAFSPFIERNYDVAHTVQTLTEPNERIFVWGINTEIYTLSGTLPSTRYIWHEHIHARNYYDETISSLEEIQPRFVVMFEESTLPDQDLIDAYVQSRYSVAYVATTTIDTKKISATIYRRK